MRSAAERWVGPTLVLLLGIFALFQYHLAEWRPVRPDRKIGREFRVVNAADSGPGTLREVIFLADAMDERARIVLAVEAINLQSPLPPLVNPAGIEIDGADSGCVVDGSQVDSAPLLELNGGPNRLQGFAIAGAGVAAVASRSQGNVIRGMRFTDNDVGVSVLEGSDWGQVEDNQFAENHIGLRIDSEGTALRVHNNEFRGHEFAAIWAGLQSSRARASSDPIIISANRFHRDFVSLIAYDLSVRIESNQFSASREAALYLAGQGAVSSKNRIRAGQSMGILLEEPDGTQVFENEIDGNAAVAVLVKGGRNANIRGNRIYRNGYGVAVVFGDALSPHVLVENLVLAQRFDGLFVVGSSPVLRSNRLLSNRLAGLRILDYLSKLEKRTSSPLLSENVSFGNGLDEVVVGEYRASPEESQ